MNKMEIMNRLSRKLSKASFKFKKYSPEILVVAGIAGTVASTVIACKATTKLPSVLDDSKKEIDRIHDATKKGQDSKKELTIVYTQTAVKLIRLYSPAIALGTLSVTCILSGYNITRKRNVALAAAYTAVDKGFKEYRDRVIERFGKELDNELRFNVKTKEIEETTIDKDGKETKTTKTIKVADPNEYSDYARIFDESCIGWSKDPEYNLMFLKQQQACANKILQQEGYLYLNDVYEMIGIPKTKAGQVVGWIYDENDPNADNFVDFGIYDLYNKKAREFVNGYERSIVLDFNVDGNIWYLMQ